MQPYLEGEVKGLFDAWHGELVTRFGKDLTFTEIRKGVQALSSLYVERRGDARKLAAALDGAGKRAAFALFYAPLHFLVVHHVVREIGFDELPAGRLWDLGCGTGVAGAAWGAAIREYRGSGSAGGEGPRPGGLKVSGVDRAPFAVAEAAATYRAFGLQGEVRRTDLAKGAPRGRDPVVLAFAANELVEAARRQLLLDLGAGRAGGRTLLVIEPLAGRVAPWWSNWGRSLGEGALAVHLYEWRRRLHRPEWIAKMDRAAGLDHGELSARVLGILI
jgi:hypothetical protein